VLIVNSSAEILFKTKTKESVKEFINLTGYGNWRLRAIGARGLASIADSAAVEALVKLLGDSHPVVRINAAYSLGAIAPQGIRDSLHDAFEDRAVSRYITLGVLSNAPFEYEYISQILFGDLPEEVISGLAPSAAFCDYNNENRKEFIRQFPGLDEEIRKIVMEAMVKLNYSNNKNILNKLLNDEESDDLVRYIDKLIDVRINRKGE
jgi:HEAT repeat protein